ncbi:MAG TPA: IspD/TarI family cytidylyltransferase [Acidimicrobiales bacterium]|nr:IspD/TarI family cytidylyltransferase [Acidimicrobiales bacterium]
MVAAGSGARFGARKQYQLLHGRRVVDVSLDAARTLVGSAADGLVVVVPQDRAGEPMAGADVVVAGGLTRSDSVRAGLEAVPDAAAVIVVHDAARPLASPALFAAVVAALDADGVDGAVPGLPVTDTVKRVRGGEVVATLDRAELVAVQTPQAFRADILRKAHASGLDATDDAALVELAGGRVVIVPGEPTNVKITTSADLDRTAGG